MSPFAFVQITSSASIACGITINLLCPSVSWLAARLGHSLLLVC